jgi:hypothetical protein
VRRIVVLASTAGLTVAGAVALAIPATAAAPGGGYVALPGQSRVVDTRTGADHNHKGAVAHGRSISVKIAGLGGVPASGAASVLATVTAVSATSSGGIVAYTGRRPATTNVQFSTGRTTSDTAVLPLSGGRVTLFNTAAKGTVQIVVDVSGYYTSGTASTSDSGVFHSVPAARVVNTVTGAYGNHKGAVGAGSHIAAKIGGHDGVPVSAGAAAVTITVWHATKAGAIIAYRPDEPRQNLALAHFPAGLTSSSFAVLRLSGGTVDLVNTSKGRVDITVDVIGYYTTGFAQTARTFQTLVQTHLQTTNVRAGGNLAVTVAGKGGVPLSSVSAALVTIHAVAPSAAGALQAWRYGQARPGRPAALQFTAGPTRSAVTLVPLSSGGRFAIRNTSSRAVAVDVDIDGYVPAAAIVQPTARSTAHYLRNLVDDPTGNAAAMAALGKADKADTFVLLDIGAQLNKENGVALTGTDTPISYANLVAALNSYVAGFGSAGGKGTVAIGTSNSAEDWTNYSGTARGSDWAHKVVDQITAPTGVTIAGADDIEPGFGTMKESDAKAWETAFLAADAHVTLYFNGSADGCPKTWTPRATCAHGWTEAQLYALATGSRTLALPQVYFGYMATQWAEIDATGGGHLRFAGVLSEYVDDSGTSTPAQSFVALSRAVASVTATRIGSVVADI